MIKTVGVGDRPGRGGKLSPEKKIVVTTAPRRRSGAKLLSSFQHRTRGDSTSTSQPSVFFQLYNRTKSTARSAGSDHRLQTPATTDSMIDATYDGTRGLHQISDTPMIRSMSASVSSPAFYIWNFVFASFPTPSDLLLMCPVAPRSKTLFYGRPDRFQCSNIDLRVFSLNAGAAGREPAHTAADSRNVLQLALVELRMHLNREADSRRRGWCGWSESSAAVVCGGGRNRGVFLIGKARVQGGV